MLSRAARALPFCPAGGTYPKRADLWRVLLLGLSMFLSQVRSPCTAACHAVVPSCCSSVLRCVLCALLLLRLPLLQCTNACVPAPCTGCQPTVACRPSAITPQLLYILGIEMSGVTVATCMQPAIPVRIAKCSL